MPWKASSVVDERVRFVFEHQRGLHTMTELCAIYEITRETGYYWLRRYQQGGLEALSDRNRAPRQHPNQTPEEIAEAVLAGGEHHRHAGGAGRIGVCAAETAARGSVHAAVCVGGCAEPRVVRRLQRMVSHWGRRAH